MELSREFVIRLSDIFFNEESDGAQIETRLSEILLNKEMGNNLLNDAELKKKGL